MRCTLEDTSGRALDERLHHGILISNIVFQERRRPMMRFPQVSSAEKLIQDEDLMPFGEKLVDDWRSNEAAACNQISHFATSAET
jgi:hypothetical protein